MPLPQRRLRRSGPALALALAVGSAVLVAPGAGAVEDPGPSARTSASTTRVVVISVDAFGSYAARRLGPDRAPTLHRMLAEGAGTLEARTVREQTATLPNHTSMVTGRRVLADRDGHGVTWNDDRLDPRTVQDAAGHSVASVFSAVRRAGGRPALFASKTKLSLFDRSWPKGVARMVVDTDNDRLARTARRDLKRRGRALTFLHLSLPDDVGHDHGFSSRRYLRAAEHADHLVGTVLRAIRSERRLRRHTTVILTADHGGRGDGHLDPTTPANYRIPFAVWGVGVADGADLYDLNPDYADPGRRRPRYGAALPPVRNGDAANLALRLLGLEVLPDSLFGHDDVLDVQ